MKLGIRFMFVKCLLWSVSFLFIISFSPNYYTRETQKKNITIDEETKSLLEAVITTKNTENARDTYVQDLVNNPGNIKDPTSFAFSSRLIDPTVYTAEQQQAALAFIHMLNGSNPIVAVDFDQLAKDQSHKSKTNIFQDPKVKQYWNILRGLAALKTTAINSLLTLFKERLPISLDTQSEVYKTLKEAWGSDKIGALSQLKLEEILATHRVTRPDWHRKLDQLVQQNNVAALHRETAILLSEVLAQFYQFNRKLDLLQLQQAAQLLAESAPIRMAVEHAITQVKS
jgi:hypothetical protein